MCRHSGLKHSKGARAESAQSAQNRSSPPRIRGVDDESLGAVTRLERLGTHASREGFVCLHAITYTSVRSVLCRLCVVRAVCAAESCGLSLDSPAPVSSSPRTRTRRARLKTRVRVGLTSPRAAVRCVPRVFVVSGVRSHIVLRATRGPTCPRSSVLIVAKRPACVHWPESLARVAAPCRSDAIQVTCT